MTLLHVQKCVLVAKGKADHEPEAEFTYYDKTGEYNGVSRTVTVVASD